MGNMIGACGLVCSECEGYKATQANDAEAVARIAAEWSKQFGTEIPPAAVWCDGCLSDSARKCGHCAECEIRTCVVGRGLANCAGCADYACETLTKFFEMAPCCKGRLEELRAAGQ